MAQPAVGPSGGIELPHEIRVVSQSVSHLISAAGDGLELNNLVVSGGWKESLESFGGLICA